MADIRTLKLALLADTAQFSSGMNQAGKDTDDFNTKVGNFAKAAGAAFLALGAAAATAAIKIGIDGVKAAIEDEKAQAILAQTLKNTTKATADQVKGVEDYITKTSLAFGVTDDKLRPSFDRLVRSTHDVTKAQQLQSLALDIAAGTQKDLGQVSEALGKAYDGNFTALKKLGVPIDDSIIKSKDFTKVVEVLSATFKDQATIQAETFAGKMDRIKIAVGEAKEQLGASLLPILEKIAGFVTKEVVPAFQGLIDGLTGKKSVRQATIDAGGNVNLLRDEFNKSYDSGINLGVAFRELADTIGLIGGNSSTANPEFSKFIDNITKLVEGTNKLFENLSKIKSLGSDILNFVGLQGPLESVGNFGEKYNPLYQGGNKNSSMGTTVNVNVSGAVDKIGTARTVVTAINSAAKQGTTNKLAANTSLR